MTEKTLDPAVLSSWIGFAEQESGTIDVQPARFMAMTLDEAKAFATGDALPPLWHWLYFLKTAPLQDLGQDGHPAVGGFLPSVALPRRMWAGGRFTFQHPLRIGQRAAKTSTIKNVAVKQGRSGALCFVTVEHVVSVGGECCFT